MAGCASASEASARTCCLTLTRSFILMFPVPTQCRRHHRICLDYYTAFLTALCLPPDIMPHELMVVRSQEHDRDHFCQAGIAVNPECVYVLQRQGRTLLTMA